jgi:hypothetical protein
VPRSTLRRVVGWPGTDGVRMAQAKKTKLRECLFEWRVSLIKGTPGRPRRARFFVEGWQRSLAVILVVSMIGARNSSSPDQDGEGHQGGAMPQSHQVKTTDAHPCSFGANKNAREPDARLRSELISNSASR